MIAHRIRLLCRVVMVLTGAAIGPATAGQLYPDLPKTGLSADEVAIVVNENDPDSRRIAEYYRERRGIPRENVLRVRFPSKGSTLSRDEFASAREALLRQTAPRIQAYALAWTFPYRVECMSITAAIAFGFDRAYCSAEQCADTKSSGYYGSSSSTPYDDYRFRPAMLLAGRNFEEVKHLIDRGIASDRTYPDHTAYLLSTSDEARSVRKVFFGETAKALGESFRIEALEADSIKDRQDVLFYFTGVIKVENLSSLRFVPGAMADHLTSAGGVLEGEGQMSVLRWLEAGATASYGAVVEPCNRLQKFPVPGVAMWRYALGDTLIEAYWKSVAWPGEGVFVGEPLARPFAPQLRDLGNGRARLKIFSPQAKSVVLEVSESPMGPYRAGSLYPLKPGLNEVEVDYSGPGAYFRIAFPK